MGLKISLTFWPCPIDLLDLLTPVSNFLLSGGSCSSACSHKPRRAWKHSQALMPTGREQPEPGLEAASMLHTGQLLTACPSELRLQALPAAQPLLHASGGQQLERGAVPECAGAEHTLVLAGVPALSSAATATSCGTWFHWGEGHKGKLRQSLPLPLCSFPRGSTLKLPPSALALGPGSKAVLGCKRSLEDPGKGALLSSHRAAGAASRGQRTPAAACAEGTKGIVQRIPHSCMYPSNTSPRLQMCCLDYLLHRKPEASYILLSSQLTPLVGSHSNEEICQGHHAAASSAQARCHTQAFSSLGSHLAHGLCTVVQGKALLTQAVRRR